MILEMKYECGCVMKRERERDPFVLVHCCERHYGNAPPKPVKLSSAPIHHPAGADWREGVANGTLKLDEMPSPKTRMPGFRDVKAPVEATRHFYPQYRDEGVFAICEYGVDNNIAEVFDHGGKTAMQNASLVANALNAYVGSKHGPDVTQRATKAVAARDVEWSKKLDNIIREMQDKKP